MVVTPCVLESHPEHLNWPDRKPAGVNVFGGPASRCGQDPVLPLHPTLGHLRGLLGGIAHKDQNPVEPVHPVLVPWQTPSWRYALSTMRLQTCSPNTVQQHQVEWV